MMLLLCADCGQQASFRPDDEYVICQNCGRSWRNESYQETARRAVEPRGTAAEPRESSGVITDAVKMARCPCCKTRIAVITSQSTVTTLRPWIDINTPKETRE